MGKKKQDIGNEDKLRRHQKDEKGSKKTYSLSGAKGKGDSDGDKQELRVKIAKDVEQRISRLIQAEHELLASTKMRDISNRLSSKKLTDMYTSLQEAGFSHAQIEASMSNTVTFGGDLTDALDWLCLNLADDKLPAGFSNSLEQADSTDKTREKFDAKLQYAPTEELKKDHRSKKNDSVAMGTTNNDVRPKEGGMKDWILQYAGRSSSDEDDDDDDANDKADSDFDPNEKYLELTAKLLDAKESASMAKQENNKQKQKELSKTIRDIITAMNSLELDPDFNPEVKIKDVDAEKGVVAIETMPEPTHKTEAREADWDQGVAASEDVDVGQGFALFENMAAADAPKPKATDPKVKEDVRNFEYTRQQWTGKSPKQFLIDWCRKHKYDAPRFEKVQCRGNKWKCKALVESKKDGKTQVTPEILCLNVKEAEHLAATLALYHLCKGQSVQQLLPPPYRDVWLEWLEREKTQAKEAQLSENKPRDQFITRLMKKVKQKVDKDGGTADNEEGEEDLADTWEDLDDEEEDQGSRSPSRPVSAPRPKRRLPNLTSLEMKEVFMKRLDTPTYQGLLKVRQSLPVYQQRDAVLKVIDRERVVVIAGETGSGKSTQIPQFILEHYATSSRGQMCNIVCTQPRRISAVSLAMRVSQELGDPRLGAKESLCGYQIRFETRCGPNTHLTYCTTGVLLRRLQSDSELRGVTHIVVDEVHERSVQSDFLLIILRRLLTIRPDLKIILMSATMDSEKFANYFKHCQIVNIPGKTFPVEVFHVEDVIQKTNYVLDEDSPYALSHDQLVHEEEASIDVTGKGGEKTKVEVSWSKESISTIDHTSLSADVYSLKTRNTVTRMNPKRINMELIVELLLYLEKSPEFTDTEGAVLIFMPGLADIQELYELLMADRNFSSNQKYQIIALHSVLSSADQNRAFSVPPPGTRKVVIATNIAETGITIPDVVFVIDTGKVKETRFMETSQMSALREVFISKANAKQRQGRAGRVREGFCFRMYSSEKFREMAPYTVPEIQRVPLEELCLHIMKCDLGTPQDFLSEALDPPRSVAVSRAMSMLQEVGACTQGCKLTSLGHHLASLPVHVRIGKMLLYGAIFDCLEPVAIVAASMSTKSPFVAPINKLDLAQAAKVSMATACSDHMTVYKAFTGWIKAKQEGSHIEHQYCQSYFLRRNTLLEIQNLANDLIKLVRSIGFSGKGDKPCNSETDSLIVGDVLQITKYSRDKKSELDNKTIAMVKASICAGLYPNVAKVTYKAKVDAAANPTRHVCVAETAQGSAAVHPSSINRHLATNGWIAFQEKVTTSKVYLRETTLISPFSLLLFGGKIHVEHTHQMVTVDDRVTFQAFAKTGVIFRELRKLLDCVLEQILEKPSLDLSSNSIIGVIKELLWTER